MKEILVVYGIILHSCIGITINHFKHPSIPIKQPGFHGKYPACFFVACFFQIICSLVDPEDDSMNTITVLGEANNNWV